MKLFNCKVCQERNLRIADLQKQVEFLKRLTQPSIPIPTIDTELDYAMDGASRESIQSYETPVSEEEREKQEKIDQERDRILSGNY